MSRLTDSFYEAVAQAQRANRSPARWVLGRVVWTKLCGEAHYGIANAPARAALLGLPVLVDEECGPGFGLVVR